MKLSTHFNYRGDKWFDHEYHNYKGSGYYMIFIGIPNRHLSIAVYLYF